MDRQHTPRDVQLDWQRLNARLQQLRQEHASRSETEGVNRTLEHWHRTGTRPPRAFFQQHPEAVAAWFRVQASAATGVNL